MYPKRAPLQNQGWQLLPLAQNDALVDMQCGDPTMIGSALELGGGADVGSFQWEMLQEVERERDMYRDLCAQKDRKLSKCFQLIRAEQERCKKLMENQ